MWWRRGAPCDGLGPVDSQPAGAFGGAFPRLRRQVACRYNRVSAAPPRQCRGPGRHEKSLAARIPGLTVHRPYRTIPILFKFW